MTHGELDRDQVTQTREGLGRMRAPQTRGETLPKLGVDAGPDKAWSLVDVGADGQSSGQRWQGEAGPRVLEKEGRVILGQ